MNRPLDLDWLDCLFLVGATLLFAAYDLTRWLTRWLIDQVVQEGEQIDGVGFVRKDRR